MRRVATTPRRPIVRALAPIACVVALGLGTVACGSTSKTSTQNSPTTPGASTPTSEAKAGGAGF